MISVSSGGHLVVSGNVVLSGAFPHMPRNHFFAAHRVYGGAAYPACTICGEPIANPEGRMILILSGGLGAMFHLTCGMDAQQWRIGVTNPPKQIQGPTGNQLQ